MANSGDSRAIIGYEQVITPCSRGRVCCDLQPFQGGKYLAAELSIDQKPGLTAVVERYRAVMVWTTDRPDGKSRIISCGGRVEVDFFSFPPLL